MYLLNDALNSDVCQSRRKGCIIALKLQYPYNEIVENTFNSLDVRININ